MTIIVIFDLTKRWRAWEWASCHKTQGPKIQKNYVLVLRRSSMNVQDKLQLVIISGEGNQSVWAISQSGNNNWEIQGSEIPPSPYIDYYHHTVNCILIYKQNKSAKRNQIQQDKMQYNASDTNEQCTALLMSAQSHNNNRRYKLQNFI